MRWFVELLLFRGKRDLKGGCDQILALQRGKGFTECVLGIKAGIVFSSCLLGMLSVTLREQEHS